MLAKLAPPEEEASAASAARIASWARSSAVAAIKGDAPRPLLLRLAAMHERWSVASAERAGAASDRAASGCGTKAAWLTDAHAEQSTTAARPRLLRLVGIV